MRLPVAARLFLLMIIILFVRTDTHAQQKTYCNPINLNPFPLSQKNQITAINKAGVLYQTGLSNFNSPTCYKH